MQRCIQRMLVLLEGPGVRAEPVHEGEGLNCISRELCWHLAVTQHEHALSWEYILYLMQCCLQ